MNKAILEQDFNYIFSKAIPWKKLTNKTILITGANGFLSSYIVELLLYGNDKNIIKTNIIGIARNRERANTRFAQYTKRGDLKILIHDVSKPLKLKEKVDFIIHAASQASPTYYSTDPVGTFTANTLGTYYLLDFAKNQSLESFLFISAGEIYGIQKNAQKTDEHSYGYVDPIDTRSIYAESKRMGETMCIAYNKQFKIPAKIARLYHTYGPGFRLDDGRVFADFVKNLLNNEDIIMKSDGSAIRSFCYIADTTTGLFTILLKGTNGEAYNVANDKAILSIKELAERLIRLFPKKKLKVLRKTRKKSDKYMQSKIQVNNPSIAKLKSLGFQPHFSIEQGFLRTVQSFQKT